MKLTARELIDSHPDLFKELRGNLDQEAYRPWPPEIAPPGSVVFVSNQIQLDQAISNEPSLIIGPESLLTPALKGPFSKGLPPVFMATKSIPLAMAAVNKYFDPSLQTKKTGIHTTAIIDPLAKIDSSALIGPYCVIGAHSVIDAGVQLTSHVNIDQSVHIQSGTTVHAFVKIGRDTQVGKNCILHANSSFGTDGFGFSKNDKGEVFKISQLGRVVLEDHVEIGSHCCVDRATLHETRIKEHSKLDNFCHIGHNTIIGKRALIAAGFKVAGSCIIGDNFICAGDVSVADHIHITDNVILGGRSGVTKDIDKPGAYTGFPTEPFKDGLRTLANLSKVTELRKRLSEIEKILTK